jgi:hypothetical protein
MLRLALGLIFAVLGIVIRVVERVIDSTKSTKPKLREMGIIIFVLAVSWWVGFRIGENIRRNAFTRMAANATPIIAALGKFEARHGIPAAKLEDLVPEFMTNVPGTGAGGYPLYFYGKGFMSPDNGSNAWVLYVPVGEYKEDSYTLMYVPNQKYGTNRTFIFETSAGKWAVADEEVK